MVVFQQCEQMVFAIVAHVFSRQIEGYHFQIAEQWDHTWSRQIAEFIHEICRIALAYIKKFDEICLQVVHRVI